MYIREDQADIAVYLNGKQMFDAWFSFSGGELTANDVKTRPGGMGEQVSVGGLATRSDLTVTTQFTDIVANAHPAFESAVGNGSVKVVCNWLDPVTKQPIPGAIFTRTGILKGASTPEANTDANAVGMYSISVSADQAAA